MLETQRKQMAGLGEVSNRRAAAAAAQLLLFRATLVYTWYMYLLCLTCTLQGIPVFEEVI